MSFGKIHENIQDTVQFIQGMSIITIYYFFLYDIIYVNFFRFLIHFIFSTNHKNIVCYNLLFQIVNFSR